MSFRPNNKSVALFLTLLFVVPALTGRAQAAEWRIDSPVGDGTPGNVGQPFGLVVGPDGGLYICEVENHRIRRFDLNTQALTTVAGTGRAGYSGDGRLALDADLNEPYEIRFDDAGNLFVVEMKNHIVRRIDGKTHIITTVAGCGREGFGGDGGPATEALLKQPHSIDLDGKGGLLIADIGNHRIRRVDLASGTIRTIAGNGEKTMPQDGQQADGNPMVGPRALFVDGDTLWIALREGHSVWRMDLSTGTLTHVAGTGERGYTGDGGPAREATFDGPKGIAVGPAGEVHVVDTENQAIRMIDTQSGVITTIAGSGPNGRGFGGDGGPATAAKMDRPHGICVGADGAVYVGDTNNHRVRRVWRSGE
ncbi:MAG: hypothetical protein JNK74_20695 [Candidatus Hydrogenedentes bacterium]|nr:hypothetical protein [Candidatus Hydrogenedentota bacterium]